MQYSVAAVLAAAAGVYAQSAASNISYTTEIVTAVTTYCPEATVFAHAGTTYSVTSATTLTITDCPCTITRPVSTSVSTECDSTTVAATSAPAVVPYSNGTATLVSSSSPIGTGSPGSGSGSSASGSTGSTAPIVTAGAGKSAALSGVALAGVLGAAAFLL